MKKLLSIIFLVLILMSNACSKDDSETPPEPSVDETIAVKIVSINYEETVEGVYKFNCTFSAKSEEPYTIELDNGAGEIVKPSKTYNPNTNYTEVVSYDKLGNFNLILDATNTFGSIDSHSKEVEVIDRTFAINLMSAYSHTEGDSQVHEFKFSANPKANYKIKFNDGAGNISSPSEQYEAGKEYILSANYATPGAYEAELTATDINGNEEVFKLDVVVVDRKPTFEFSLTKVAIESNGSEFIYNYSVDFNATTYKSESYEATIEYGENSDKFENLESSKDYSKSISFGTFGDYTVVVRVKDSDGNEVVEEMDLTIEEYVDPALNDPAGLFIQPFIHMQHGQLRNDFYGSGDVNQDEAVNSVDAELIRSGTVNKYTDVNRDGETNSQDAACIDEGMPNTWLRLAHDYWNVNLTVSERKEFCIRTHKRSNELFMQTQMPGWECTRYAFQSVLNIQGLVNPEGFMDHWFSGNYTPAGSTEYNAWFNLLVCEVGVSMDITSSANAHSVIGFPIGDDLSKPENWLFIDTATGTIITPDSHYMKANEDIEISYIQNTMTNGYGLSPLLEFDIHEGGSWTKAWQHPDIKSLQNPNRN